MRLGMSQDDHLKATLPPPSSLAASTQTLSSEEISHFFVRLRRDRDAERWDIRLDAALREILQRANDFVPSEAGGILLDDPRAKLAGSPAPRLTFIAAYGPDALLRLGQRVPSDRGFAGAVYRQGQPLVTHNLDRDDPLRLPILDQESLTRTVSVLGVPVIVGESICGVLALMNRRHSGSYTATDIELLRIFAAYMSSSIQNALDAIRNRALARTDDLTGLFNSRYFHLRLQDEIVRADRESTELSVLFIDLDDFKGVNDRFGHLAGSWTLREVARLLSENAPPGTVLARYGGDEFVMILPGAKLHQAHAVAETLRGTIAAADLGAGSEPSLAFSAAGTRRPVVTASIGVASYRDHLAPGGTQQRRENILLRLADAAMYRAKAQGRNRVEIAEAEE